ncbi:MAG TPA: hypothetical protein VK071_06405 [Tissierellales bacterium]|nr:hypothetical protein [Tissierellales bacterium]
MKKKIAKFISIITVVPLVAFYIITLLFTKSAASFNGNMWYLYCVFFLTIIPILAYPLQSLIPEIKKMGRKGERKLAFILAVISYVFGTSLVFVLKGPKIVKQIFLAYLISGLSLSFVNKVIGLKASGHACGISGPLTLLHILLGKKILWLVITMPIVFWSRLNLGRHTIKELITGTFIGIVSSYVALAIL